MYLNKAIIIGNLTRDPEMRALPSGIQVCSFSVATNRVFKDKDGNKKEQADFHNIVVFGRQAETAGQYLKKGQSVLIEGRIQTRSWDDKGTGEKKYRTEIVADRVQFGRPIGRFESLARMLDRGETLMLAARMMVLRAALLLDQSDGDASREAACDAVSRARDFTTEALSRVVVDAVQVHGGYGFVNDFPVEKLMRDARAFDAVTGDEAFERVLARTARPLAMEVA